MLEELATLSNNITRATTNVRISLLMHTVENHKNLMNTTACSQ